MKKNIKFVILLLFMFVFAVQPIFAADTDDAIKSPDQKTYSSSPGYNDTYFTYYTDIIGYKSNGLWGFYSEDGVINIPPMYSNIQALDSKYIKVKRNGRSGIINTDGYQLIPPIYDDIDTFYVGSADFFKVRQYGRYGVVDTFGNQIVPIYYQGISKLDESYLEITQNYKHGVYSIYEGKEIISTVYDDIKLLRDWFMFKRESKWGLLDKTENILIEAKYDDINFLNNNYFSVKNNKLWGTVTSDGKSVIPLKYDKIEVGRAQYIKVKHSGKWGVCLYDGTVVVATDKGPLEINRVLKKLY